MKTSWILGAGFLWAVTGAALQAQSAGDANAAPPPHPPFVAPVPNPGQWTVTLTYPGDDQAQGAKNPTDKPKHRLHQIVATKSQNLKRAVEVYDDGTSDTYWFVGNLILLPESVGHDVGIVDFNQANREYGEAGNPIESPGFAGVGWVKLKYYDAVATMQNQPCYHYALKSGDAIEIEAWINVKTVLPVSYRTGGVTYDYAFGSAPGDLELPPKYAEALKSYEQIQNRRKALENDPGS